MKKYKVVVDGVEYEIGIEQLESDQGNVAAPAQPAPVAEKKVQQPAAQPGGNVVKCPMPGTIMSVKVSQGSAVKKGQVLMVLEAMKMENEILAPQAGTIASINVQAGAAVNTGAILCTLR